MGAILKKWTVLSIGIIFHVTFIMSIFDIYFVSPLVHGMRHFNSVLGPGQEDAHIASAPGPAKRLFLIVGDGLRADKCFEKVHHPIEQQDMYLAPYIRSKVVNEATFGISHTRMPTESRPGHVAMIAGFYEDVSAVTKGWQENPVDFDSVFNQSRHTWSFGSPDILPMFSLGAEEGRIDDYMYGHDFEDFTKSSIELDKFVFDNLDELFASAATNSSIAKALNEDRVVFFLHLLGIDTAGHGYRPYSAEYYDNIRYIDTKIEELEKSVNEFYGNDGQTAWVFTADHGMTDFGSHGDGHPNNTRTPLVAWGAGVNTPVRGQENHDEETLAWDLPVNRYDVNQADITSLMAYLIGGNYPANSVGELPLPYVDAEPLVKAKAMAANAFSISEQYLVKEEHVKAVQIQFKPFPELSDGHSVADRQLEIQTLIANQEFEQAIDASEELMVKSLLGLRYLQTYNWQLLKTLVSMGFLGWIGYAYTSFLYLFIVSEETKKKTSPWWINAISGGVFAILSGLFYRQRSPPNYYFYAFFPVFFWHVILMNLPTLIDGTVKLAKPAAGARSRTWLNILSIIFGVGVIEAMVYGYFHREVFSVLLVCLFMPWPWVHNWNGSSRNWKFTVLWSIACVSLSIFTVQPVVKVENLDMIIGSGILMFVLSFVYTIHLNRVLELSGITMVICGVQLGLIILSVIVTRSSSLALQARKGLPIGSQLVGWMTLCFSLVAPFMHSLSPVSDFRFRFLSTFMVFCPTMVILSISYEGYFYVAFALLLFSWFVLEGRSKGKERSLRFGDFRLALVSLFFTHIAFFGTGNVASLSSFSLDSVYRLIPIFNPFAMGALLIFKIFVPFVLMSVALGIVNKTMLLPSYAVFSMVLSLTDIMSLNFFFLVVDEGSWLDIGTGISHFCICSLMCLFIILLEYLSSILVGDTTPVVQTKPVAQTSRPAEN